MLQKIGSLLGRLEGGAAWTVRLAHVEKVKWYRLRHIHDDPDRNSGLAEICLRVEISVPMLNCAD